MKSALSKRKGFSEVDIYFLFIICPTVWSYQEFGYRDQKIGSNTNFVVEGNVMSSYGELFLFVIRYLPRRDHQDKASSKLIPFWF